MRPRACRVLQKVPRSVAELARRLPPNARWPSCSWWASRAPTSPPPCSASCVGWTSAGIVVGRGELHRPRPAVHPHRRGGRDRARRAPRAALGDGRAGRRRVQRAAGPARRVGGVRPRDARRRWPRARDAGRTLRPLGVTGLLAPVVDVGLAPTPRSARARTPTRPRRWRATPTPSCGLPAGADVHRRAATSRASARPAQSTARGSGPGGTVAGGARASATSCRSEPPSRPARRRCC